MLEEKQLSEVFNTVKWDLTSVEKASELVKLIIAERKIGILGSVSRFKEALKLAKGALSRAYEINSRNLAGVYLKHIGGFYWYLGNRRNALIHLKLAVDIGFREKNFSLEADSLRKIGIVYYSNGEYDRSLEYFFEALEKAKCGEDVWLIGAISGNIAVIYELKDDIESARKYYEKARIIFRDLGDRRMEGVQIGNIGIMLYNTGKIKKAITLIEKSISIAENVGNKHSMVTMFSNLGKFYFELGKLKKALTILEKTEKMADEIQMRTERARVLILAAVIKNELYGESAKPIILENIRILERLKEFEFLVDAYILLSRFEKNSGNSKRAKTVIARAREIALRNDFTQQLKRINEEFKQT